MNLDILSNDCPSYSSIVAKIAKGDLWLDNNKSPTIAIVYSYCVGGYGILGVYNKSKLGLRCFLEKNVFPVIKESGKTVFEFSTENTAIGERNAQFF
ncbi:MAG: hypothetical protein ACLFPS_05165 [Clostridia bacterium]